MSVTTPGPTGPIFVVGSPRSGTTLLQRMLRSHPRISSPTGESHFIVPLHHRRAEFGDLTERHNMRRLLAEMYRINPEFLDTDLHGMRFDIKALCEEFCAQRLDSVAAVVSALYGKNARGEGRVRWLDKTPYYILHLPTILEMFPDAQVVHIVRDGRDCALSMLGRRDDLLIYNVYHAAKVWQQYVEAGRAWGAGAGRGLYFELRYEDMLEDPVGAMQRLSSALGEDYSGSLVDFQKSRDPKSKTPLLSRELQRDNREKWRHEMTRWSIRVFESAAADTLRTFGYPLVTEGERLPMPVRAAYRLHNLAASRLRMRRRPAMADRR